MWDFFYSRSFVRPKNSDYSLTHPPDRPSLDSGRGQFQTCLFREVEVWCRRPPPAPLLLLLFYATALTVFPQDGALGLRTPFFFDLSLVRQSVVPAVPGLKFLSATALRVFPAPRRFGAPHPVVDQAVRLHFTILIQPSDQLVTD